MALEIKICGLSTALTVRAAARAGADYLGFVIHPRSPRRVTPEQARTLMGAMDDGPRPLSVALVCDLDDAHLATIVTAMKPDWIQCHGAETPERVAMIKARFGCPVIKAVGVSQAADLDRAQAFAGAADRLLLDARPPEGSERSGGHGTAFDWRLLEGFTPGVPWWLAGGLTPDTVAGAIAATAPMGVDVSSGVEAARGVKSDALIERFIGAAHGAASGARTQTGSRLS